MRVLVQGVNPGPSTFKTSWVLGQDDVSGKQSFKYRTIKMLGCFKSSWMLVKIVDSRTPGFKFSWVLAHIVGSRTPSFKSSKVLVKILDSRTASFKSSWVLVKIVDSGAASFKSSWVLCQEDGSEQTSCYQIIKKCWNFCGLIHEACLQAGHQPCQMVRINYWVCLVWVEELSKTISYTVMTKIMLCITFNPTLVGWDIFTDLVSWGFQIYHLKYFWYIT